MQGDGRCFKLFLALSILLLQNVKGGGAGHSHSHNLSLRDAKVIVRCIERERQALLAFKRGLGDEFNQFFSWGSEAQKQDCCRWEGVYCSNQTGHVIQLDLGYSVNGKGKMITPKLIELHHLQYLDLSGIDFNGIQIPDFIGSLTNLRYLSLSRCYLVGQIPSRFGNLTRLNYLDLSYNQLQAENLNWPPALSSLTYLDLSYIDFNGSQIPDFIGSLTNLRNLSLYSCNLVGQIPSQFGNLTRLKHLDLPYNYLQAENLNWLPALSFLTYLDLREANLSNVFDWPEAVLNKLPKLVHLALTECSLPPPPPILSSTLSKRNSSTSLETVVLSDNHLTSSIFLWLSNYSTSLSRLYLSQTNLTGLIPDVIGNMSSLVYLDLSDNQITGLIHGVFGNMSSLVDMDLSHNQITGLIPDVVGNMISLVDMDLSHNQITGLIPDVIGNMSSLVHLDLSDNQITSLIPDVIGNMSSLVRLVLSHNQITGLIPSVIGNMSSLVDLDLSDNQITGLILNDIGNMSSLAYLDLSGNQITGLIPGVIGNMTSLVSLDLSHNQITSLIHGVFGNMSSLKSLDLSDNQITGLIPGVIGNMSSLVDLDLSDNQITGLIPGVIGNMSFLTDLDLSHNQITGLIPDVIGNMSSLVHLDLSDNQIEGGNPNSFATMCNLQTLYLPRNCLSGQLSKFIQLLPRCAQNSLEYLDLNANRLSGKIPESIGQMSQLGEIDFSMNSLKGVVSETHFSKLSKLKYLNLSFNSLVLNFHSHWVPPFQLWAISLASCKVGHLFPKWLQTQYYSFHLDISNAGISDILPSWFWSTFREAEYINLSQNLIRGIFTNLTVEFEYLPALSSNQIEGPIPSTLSQASYMDLSNNNNSGSLSFLCASADMSLTYLNLSSNIFSGELPDCWSHLETLVMLDLSKNAFSGKIPMTIASLFQMETLKLRSNRFIGEFPSSLKNCTSLEVIDLGENELSGPIPTWLGVSFKYLTILMLSTNHFNGSIPSQLCHLTHIQIMDFSRNNISGSIPKCLNNLTTLAQKGNPSLSSTHSYYSDFSDRTTIYEDDASFIWKGRMQTYKSTLGLVKRIDLSSNRLTGEIPSEITHLVGLISLNLSRNQLTGQIAPEIGNLQSLDSLDLSRNQIEGRIPTSLSRIDGLGFLDLSYNNLSGKIPIGTQLQSFDPSVYAGNPQLCGPPLKNMCADQNELTEFSNEEDKDELMTRGFYISMGLGFAAGFWGVCFTLIFNRSWRYTYFKFLNGLNDWLYVRIALIKRQLKLAHV